MYRYQQQPAPIEPDEPAISPEGCNDPENLAMRRQQPTGTHEEGLGWNPNGVFCGECSASTCRGCPNEGAES